MRTLALFIVLAVFSATSTLAKPRVPRETRRSGDCKVTILIGPRDNRVDPILRAEEGQIYRRTKHIPFFYGPDGAVPTQVVRGVLITLGKRRFAFPAPLYHDLGYPSARTDYSRSPSAPDFLTLYREGPHWQISYSGGDGAGRWHCLWKVDPVRLIVSRSIRVTAHDYSPWTPSLTLIPRGGR